MANLHCEVVAQVVSSSNVVTSVCAAKPMDGEKWISPSLLAPMIAFASAIIALLWNGWQQRVVEARDRVQNEATARATVYAELWRVREEVRSTLDFLNRDSKLENGMIWIPVFRSICPNKDSLSRIAPLTVREVGRITTAYYIYQEAIVFLKASALWVVPLVGQTASGQPLRRSPFFSIEEDAIEYVYRQDGRPDHNRHHEAITRLGEIEETLRKALDAIETAAMQRMPKSDLARFIAQRRIKAVTPPPCALGANAE